MLISCTLLAVATQTFKLLNASKDNMNLMGGKLNLSEEIHDKRVEFYKHVFLCKPQV